MHTDENPPVRRFREYLRINTMQPTPNYDAALKYLEQQAKEIGLDFQVVESEVKDKPFVLMTWKGRKPDLQAILLSSHMDVVPVFPESWTYPPFSAHKDEKGDIYARGSQDMKCVSNWYLEAIRRLKEQGMTFIRTIHLLFTPDEEIGSKPTELFTNSKTFQDLNCIFGLDEGIASPSNKMRVFYGERSTWWIKITCHGQPGHGSQFIQNTAAKKLQYIINKMMDYRDAQEKKFQANPEAGLGAVTTINMNLIEGGVQSNVVPASLSATFDVRVTPLVDLNAFKQQITDWTKEAGEDVDLEWILGVHSTEMVSIKDDNPWWVAFKGACDKSKIEIQTEVFPAGTDSRFFRKAGIDMIGFSPMNNTPILLHDHNEFLNENVFIKGIDVYCNIIPALANLEP